MGGPSIVPVHTEVFTARPLPESTISGLCPTKHGPLRGSRWKPGRKTEKAGGKRAVAVSWRKKKLQNLLLKYIFGWRALNMPYTFTFFITYWITVSDLWTPLGKEGKDSEGQQCISWRQDSVKDINGRIVLRTESKKDNRHTSIIRCNAQMTLWDINETQL